MLTAPGGTGSVTILAGDPDAEDSHQFTVVMAPTQGTVELTENGVATYVGPDEDGTDSFTVEVIDNGVPPLSAQLII